jgi:D-aminoacyl-tRNA deacylase
MKAVVQRVSASKVIIDNNMFSSINDGLIIFLGIFKNDTEASAAYLAKKILDLRIFSDADDKMNLSLKDIYGELLIISQFTLCTDEEKSGNRPSFFRAEEPGKAEKLYEFFISELKRCYSADKVKQGVFAAKMKVEIVNEGPVTILLEKA